MSALHRPSKSIRTAFDRAGRILAYRTWPAKKRCLLLVQPSSRTLRAARGAVGRRQAGVELVEQAAARPVGGGDGAAVVDREVARRTPGAGHRARPGDVEVVAARADLGEVDLPRVLGVAPRVPP